VAEKAVALSQDFQNILTKSDSQRDNFMLVVSEHRQLYPDLKKKTDSSQGFRTVDLKE